jgi:DNA-binding NtrC family response regulator
MERILIVDDDKKIRRIYAVLLKSEGFKVAEASNAQSANEILKWEEIDLTLLDIKMPEVDGGIMYEIIQAFHKKSKVIVTSVYPLDDQKNLIAGANDYYDKSQGIEILLNKIKKVLKDEPKKNSHN